MSNNITKTEFMHKYGEVKATFSHYYKHTFIYRTELSDGSSLLVRYGGEAKEIYKFYLSNNESQTVVGIDPYYGSVIKDGETIDEFYDF